MTSCCHDNGWSGRAVQHEPTCRLIMKSPLLSSLIPLPLKRRMKDGVIVVGIAPRVFLIFFILQFLYRLAKGLICEVVFDDSGNQCLFNSQEVTGRPLIASQSCSCLNREFQRSSPLISGVVFSPLLLSGSEMV